MSFLLKGGDICQEELSDERYEVLRSALKSEVLKRKLFSHYAKYEIQTLNEIQAGLKRFVLYQNTEGKLDYRPSVVVSHSQGNLFFNQLYTRLESDLEIPPNYLKNNLGNLQVGSAALESKATISEYHTTGNDVVIHNILGRAFDVREPDFWVYKGSADENNHSFIDTYTNTSAFFTPLESDYINFQSTGVIAPEKVLKEEVKCTQETSVSMMDQRVLPYLYDIRIRPIYNYLQHNGSSMSGGSRLNLTDIEFESYNNLEGVWEKEVDKSGFDIFVHRDNGDDLDGTDELHLNKDGYRFDRAQDSAILLLRVTESMTLSNRLEDISCVRFDNRFLDLDKITLSYSNQENSSNYGTNFIVSSGSHDIISFIINGTSVENPTDLLSQYHYSDQIVNINSVESEIDRTYFSSDPLNFNFYFIEVFYLSTKAFEKKCVINTYDKNRLFQRLPSKYKRSF